MNLLTKKIGSSCTLPFLRLTFLSTLLIPLFVFLSHARADSPQSPPISPEFSNCSWYRAKRESVPVFAAADRSAEIKARLSRGELVCYIGEAQGFAILDWDKQKLLRSDKQHDYAGPAYVRLAELWEPTSKKNQTASEKTRETYRMMELGGVPEDPLWLMRPFLGLFLSQDPCADKTRIGCREMQENKKK